MKVRWWEKTVEYKFVIEFSDRLNLAPLDGKEETALGDLIASMASRFFLIEFKKSRMKFIGR